ncbi:hypothetical protein GLOTRDRAFT_121311 [Gloeophyllum trabeum ATCC 11539]|uniref:Uncharacterized protein n=1 Tax=Gloeophyllum trabeum (strain ATCC 11539 / FP-39264 / Madison 617) TaxID=670483 RepID=S7Q943_GLOTA|nr:uncharacterized protein GLOTRDRAFT_121311 [Gloeophyllum trabeum ATCC 11539]EPQ55963.1 hypothetical protein GLOTRDRAFT_121311 [Gloeophyllum trabeum ATCC 11539]
MFSTLSSFLPTGGSSNAAPQEQRHDVQEERKEIDASEDQAKQKGQPADEMGARRKKDRMSETFIIVRPPPSKSNHPLNLQVQLVPPNARDRSSARRSLDMSSAGEAFDPSDTPSTLTRTTSGRSDITSVYSSAYSSVASLSSMASTSSGSSGRRMIIPLYNLQAHNVMTNVVVDAGTDAKVAKFGKRGMEVIGLAVIEPVEVFGSPASFAAALLAAAPASGRTSLEGAGGLRPPGSSRGHTPEPPHTPASSNLSLSTDASHQQPRPQPMAIPENTPATTPTQSGAKKLFGKFFKGKKEISPVRVERNAPAGASLQSPPATPKGSHMRTGSITSKLNVPTGTSKRSSLIGAVPQDQNATQATVLLQPAVLGIQPALSSPSYPPHGRPTMYVWIVRRWLKGADSGLMGNMMGMLDRRQENAGAPAEQVELRFEWKRGTSASARETRKRRNRRSRPGTSAGPGDRSSGVSPASDRRASLAVASSQGASTSSLATGEQARREKRASTVDARAVSRRRSVDSHRSIASRTGLREDAQSFVTDTAEDEQPAEDDEDSDPEDSETPWVCTVFVKRVATPSSYTSFYSPTKGSFDVEGRPAEEVKVKVAQLKPTPHHPKVISLLKMPYPLPDIEVEKVHLRKRVLTPSGVARPASSSGSPDRQGKDTGRSNSGAKGFFTGGGTHGAQMTPGLVLTAEEIKDVVSSTAMWLIVREGIGGVGKVTRKGDGWRIRA